MTLYARELGVAIAQTSFDTGDSHEHAALKAFLSTLELDGDFLPSRFIQVMGGSPVTTTFSDWRPVDGVRWPARLVSGEAKAGAALVVERAADGVLIVRPR